MNNDSKFLEREEKEKNGFAQYIIALILQNYFYFLKTILYELIYLVK